MLIWRLAGVQNSGLRFELEHHEHDHWVSAASRSSNLYLTLIHTWEWPTSLYGNPVTVFAVSRAQLTLPRESQTLHPRIRIDLGTLTRSHPVPRLSTSSECHCVGVWCRVKIHCSLLCWTKTIVDKKRWCTQVNEKQTTPTKKRDTGDGVVLKERLRVAKIMAVNCSLN